MFLRHFSAPCLSVLFLPLNFTCFTLIKLCCFLCILMGLNFSFPGFWFCRFSKILGFPQKPHIGCLSRVSGDLYFGSWVFSTFCRPGYQDLLSWMGFTKPLLHKTNENKKFETFPAPKEQRPNDPWQAWYTYPCSCMGKKKSLGLPSQYSLNILNYPILGPGFSDGLKQNVLPPHSGCSKWLMAKQW